MADVGGVTREGRKGPVRQSRRQGDLTRANIEEIAQAVRTTWPTKSADNRWRRSRGARDLLEHLGEFPGQAWQASNSLPI